MKPKSRFFTAESREAAEMMAAQYFICERDQIVFEKISGEDEGSEWQVFAFLGTKEELSEMDAGYGLFYESDGVYLELYAERGAGLKLDRNALARHLSRKNIAKLNESAVKSLALKRVGREKIAKSQKEFFYGEDIVAEITKDEMVVRAKLIPPERGGALIEFDAAKKKLIKAGVIFGFDEQAIRKLVDEKKYGKSYIVAAGTAPVNGENGKLIYHFKTDQKTARPKELEGGKVDYRSLDLYEPVEEGQLLVSRTLATEGKPGTTVKGRQLSQRIGKEVAFPKGKNVLMNEDRTEMYAKFSGMVELINGSVNVSNVYKVDGDVDWGIGNIDFDGSVHIGGNVIAGHVIRATGGVVVGGVVEASEIIAGGNVEIKRGMQGMDKGCIEAGGSISLLYIERGKAVAGGSITVDASIHSTIEAGESLYAKGKRGSIIGGRAIAGEEIVANSIGSVSNVYTEIEVGVMPQKRSRISKIEKEIGKLTDEITKLDQLDAYLGRAKEKLDPSTFEKLYRSGKENRRVYNETMYELSEQLSTLTFELENMNEGRVHVLDTVHSGARIIIASDMYKVNDEIQYATFKLSDGQVTYVPCEVRK